MCAEARDELERTSPLASLTEAELRVWTHVATRETYQEIADALYLSPATVKSHLRSIYRKLGVGSRREAVALLEAEASLPD
jgi:LuxR family maltose regulon positive regulatory protein